MFQFPKTLDRVELCRVSNAYRGLPDIAWPFGDYFGHAIRFLRLALGFREVPGIPSTHSLVTGFPVANGTGVASMPTESIPKDTQRCGSSVQLTAITNNRIAKNSHIVKYMANVRAIYDLSPTSISP